MNILDSTQLQAGLSTGLRGAIAQGHPKIGGTKLVNCRVDFLVVYIIFLYLGQSYLLILPDKKKKKKTIIFLCPVPQKS